MIFGSFAGEVSLYSLLAQALPRSCLDFLVGASLLVLVVSALMLIRWTSSEKRESPDRDESPRKI